MANVTVINKNGEAWSRRFDGTFYEFKPDVPVTLPEDAAAYLFAYGKTDAERQRIVVRNGWQKNGFPGDPSGPDMAMKRLQNFIFKAAPEDAPPPKKEKKVASGTVAAKAPERAPTGVGAMSDLADAGGNRVGTPRETIHLPGKRAPLAPPLTSQA